MLQLYSHIHKVHKIQWYFNDSDLNDLESLLYVKFEKLNDYYVIKSVDFTYLDILCALEDLNFELTKIKDVMKLKILKM